RSLMLRISSSTGTRTVSSSPAGRSAPSYSLTTGLVLQAVTSNDSRTITIRMDTPENAVCSRGVPVIELTGQALWLHPPGGNVRRWLVAADGAEPLGAAHDHPDIQQQGEQEADQYRNGGAGNKRIQQSHPEGADLEAEMILQRLFGGAVVHIGKHHADDRCQAAGHQRHQIQHIDHLHHALLVLLLAHHHSPVLVAVTSHCAMQSC